jgi:hypothetical protein
MDKKEIITKFSANPERYYMMKVLSVNHVLYVSDSIGQ